MSKVKPNPKPFYPLVNDYQQSFAEFSNSARILHVAITTVIALVDNGADPSKAIEALRKPAERFRLAAYGRDDVRAV